MGSAAIDLPAMTAGATGGKTELGVRPEYVRLGTSGLPVSIRKSGRFGRHRIVRAEFEGREIAAILPEGEALPAEPRISFDLAGINLYVDSWRCGHR